MKNKITATPEQKDAFYRVEIARQLMADMYVGVTADQHVIERFFKYDINRFEDCYQAEMGWI